MSARMYSHDEVVSYGYEITTRIIKIIHDNVVDTILDGDDVENEIVEYLSGLLKGLNDQKQAHNQTVSVINEILRK